ncbi:MAG: hypothetical protein A2Z96_05990 [Spirochaetes bacterium GWB1_48_6]|nr:MAG: hypothetical protein A2Z96_05990 [Spirochaetes bacterium GWB1_48_6]
MSRLWVYFGLLFLCTQGWVVSGENFTLEYGPRVRESIPLPTLWASQVWEAQYQSTKNKVLVYGLSSPYFLLDNRKPLVTTDFTGFTMEAEDKIYVHLPGRFLFLFKRDFGERLNFISFFKKEWDRIQSVSYYKGRITLPFTLEINPSVK